MKHYTLIFSIVMAMIISLPSISLAQMHGSGHGDKMDNKSGTQMNSMHKMQDECMTMGKNMEEMSSQIDGMMKMNDLRSIKDELGVHRKRMSNMMKKMTDMQGTCKQMMSDMHSSDGMMKKSGSSTKDTDHSHTH